MKQYTDLSFKLIVAVIALFGSVMATQAQNLLQNADFSKGVEGWKKIDGTYWQLSESSGYVQRVLYTGTLADKKLLLVNNANIPVDSGDRFEASMVIAAINQSADYSLQAVVEFFDASNSLISTASSKLEPTTSDWTRVNTEVAAPVGAHSAKFILSITTHAEITQNCYARFMEIKFRKLN